MEMLEPPKILILLTLRWIDKVVFDMTKMTNGEGVGVGKSGRGSTLEAEVLRCAREMNQANYNDIVAAAVVSTGTNSEDVHGALDELERKGSVATSLLGDVRVLGW